MKKLLILFLIAALFGAVFSLSGCDMLDSFLPTDEGPTEPTDPPETEKVKITYRNGLERVGTITLDKGAVMSEDNLLQQKALRFEGYGFKEWYTDAALTTVFDHTKPINEDTVLYGSRGDLAGESIYYLYDSTTRTLTLSGEGKMFDFQYDDGAPWINYAGVIKNIVFDGNITSIGSNSFYGFSAISEVVLPDTVEVIGTAAFYQSSLTKVNFPSSLTAVKDYAFFKNTGLTELCFNPSLVNVGKGAFYECTGVESVIMNDSVAFFGNSAFLGCTAISSVFYMGTEEQYDKITFRLDNFWVKQLTNTFFLSESKPGERGPYWHYDGTGMPEKWYYTVSIYASTREKVPFIYDYVDPNVGITQENIDFLKTVSYHGYKFSSFSSEKGISYKVGTRLTRDIRLTGVRGNLCGDGMTWSFSGATGTLTLSGNGRMWDFETTKDAPWVGRNVTKVVIGSGIEYIGKNAFISLIDLKSIDIPLNVTDIHEAAFGGCYQMRYIFYMGGIHNTEMKEKLDNLSGVLDAVVYYYLPDGSGTEGAYWREITSSGMTEIVAWIIEDGKLTVGAPGGTMINYSAFSDTPWATLSDISEVVIREGVTTVGHNSFNGMNGVLKISMPDSVTRISASAFSGTGYYKDENNWDGAALYISNHLIKVDPGKVGSFFKIKDGTASVAEDAFLGCSSVIELVLNKELQGVYSTAFSGLSGIEKIYYEGLESAFGSLYNNSGTAFNNIPNDTYTLYYYNPTAPTTEGNYWVYVFKDGQRQIKIWEPLDA